MIPFQPKQSATLPWKPTANDINVYQEAGTLSLLNHPHICSIKDTFQTKDHLCMLLEYASEGSLLDLVIRTGRLKEKNARKLLRQVLSALDYCHQKNIVHRDIKLEHILLTKQGDVKIVDFNLSC